MASESEEAMRELVTLLARSLVDNPDEVEVGIADDDGLTVIELSVAQGDLGKVIGKEGRTARAMRTLISAMCARGSKRAVLDILE